MMTKMNAEALAVSGAGGTAVIPSARDSKLDDIR